MRILIFGAGAVGSLLGALLADRHDVALVARRAHAEAINRHGLHVEGIRPFLANPRAIFEPEPDPPEAVLLTVKAYDTADALTLVHAHVGPESIVATVQNGLGNWEEARSRFPRNPVAGASLTAGAMLVGPGRVRWNGVGTLVIGSARDHHASARRIVAAFQQAGVDAEFTDNLLGVLWMKAIVNAAINPISAIHRVPNGQLLDDPRLRRQLEAVCAEATSVARAEGVRLPTADPWSVVVEVATKTAQNRSSMLQSVERGQRTEIDAITGRILEAARRHGISCPANLKWYDAVRRLEAAA